jgi:hypothetical protein
MWARIVCLNIFSCHCWCQCYCWCVSCSCANQSAGDSLGGVHW